jgi:type II secretory pathway pseudopilin PulG
MLAVILMFGLIAAMVMPNVDFGGSRLVRAEARDLAAAIEFARQRAVMTGRTHVVVIEVERAAHWVEWDAPAEPQAPAPANQASGERVLDFVPPPLETGENFVAIPGELGRAHVADDSVAILGVEFPNQIAERGRVTLRFDGEGATDAASILVGETDGSNALRVEVEPLADAVVVVNAE